MLMCQRCVETSVGLGSISIVPPWCLLGSLPSSGKWALRWANATGLDLNVASPHALHLHFMQVYLMSTSKAMGALNLSLFFVKGAWARWITVSYRSTPACGAAELWMLASIHRVLEFLGASTSAVSWNILKDTQT